MWKTPRLQNCQRFLCRLLLFHRDVRITCDKLGEVGVAVRQGATRLDGADVLASYSVAGMLQCFLDGWNS